MYRIVQVGSEWIVCVGSAMLLSFERQDAAIKTVEEAEKLIRADRNPDPPLLPEFAVRLAEAAQRSRIAIPEVLADGFVERRRTARTAYPVELDAAE